MPQAQAPGLSPRPLPPLERRLDFVSEGLRFARLNRRRLAFRFLRFFLRCSPEELDYVLGKIYCEALPVSYNREEGWAKSCGKSLLQPLYYTLKKSVLWETAAAADFDFETVDWRYFRTWYAPVYDRLAAAKRLTPSRACDMPHPEAAAPMDSSLTPRSLALLWAAPFFLPSLLILGLRYGLNFIPAYRKALGLYALFDGHFRRYPCRHFVAYADESNHPCRYLAFKHSSPGLMSVVQNGERTRHPAYAFGMTDYYLTFGSAMVELSRELHMKLKRVVPVGALYLNSRTALAVQGARPKLYDVLFIDQTIWPYNDFDRKTARSFEKIFTNLNALKRRKPELRVACQLRVYRDPAQKQEVLKTMSRFFTEKIELLENSGAGESYQNVLRSQLVVTFNSTMGYEALLLGTKALFVNYAGNPYEIYSDDPRFQIYDEAADAEDFARHVDFLLALTLEGPPEEVERRHAYFDGRVQERLAAFFNGEDFR